MATATNDYLGEARRRIARLEVQAQRGTADAKSRMGRYLDTLRLDEESARASAHELAAAVDGSLEQLETELELAEHRVAAEFAATWEQFTAAIDAELRRWDAYLGRMQTKAAAKTGAAREQAEATVAELRRRRVSIGKSLADLGTRPSDAWNDAKARVLAQLDELKSDADTAWRDRGGDT